MLESHLHESYFHLECDNLNFGFWISNSERINVVKLFTQLTNAKTMARKWNAVRFQFGIYFLLQSEIESFCISVSMSRSMMFWFAEWPFSRTAFLWRCCGNYSSKTQVIPISIDWDRINRRQTSVKCNWITELGTGLMRDIKLNIDIPCANPIVSVPLSMRTVCSFNSNQINSWCACINLVTDPLWRHSVSLQ